MQIRQGAQRRQKRSNRAAMMGERMHYLVFVLGFLLSIDKGKAIQCYQCDSYQNPTLCPSEEAFDTMLNAVVDCNSFEAVTPGQFCIKIYQESPGWGGWIKMTRRCASRTDQGVAFGCRWTWNDQGVFKNTCYCETDGCNGSSAVRSSLVIASVLAVLCFVFKKWL